MDVQSLSAIKKARAALEGKIDSVNTALGTKFDTLYKDLRDAFNTVLERLTIIKGDIGNVGTRVERVIPVLGDRFDRLGTVVTRVDTGVVHVQATADKISKLVTRDNLLMKTGPVSVSGKGKLYAFVGTQKGNSQAPELKLTVDGNKFTFSSTMAYADGYNSIGLYCPQAVMGSHMLDRRDILMLLNGMPVGTFVRTFIDKHVFDYSALVNGATIDSQVFLNKPIEFDSGFATSTTTTSSTAMITTIYSLDE